MSEAPSPVGFSTFIHSSCVHDIILLSQTRTARGQREEDPQKGSRNEGFTTTILSRFELESLLGDRHAMAGLLGCSHTMCQLCTSHMVVSAEEVTRTLHEGKFPSTCRGFRSRSVSSFRPSDPLLPTIQVTSSDSSGDVLSMILSFHEEGDIGRSPRMQYHAQSLVETAKFRVTIVGYPESQVFPRVRDNLHIRIQGIQTFPIP